MSRIVFLLLFLLAPLLLSGCSQVEPVAQETAKPSSTVAAAPTATDAASLAPAAPSAIPGKSVMHLTVYQAARDGFYLIPEVRTSARNDIPAQTALELLASGPKDSRLVPVMPVGVKLRSLAIKDHIAYANFNDKLVTNNSGGSSQEILLVAAIVNTLTEFPSIEQVQILIEGQARATLAGHVDISMPLSRSESIIRQP
jgi:germination protein M